MTCFPLKEAVSGRDRDFYIYIYNFIGFVCFLCFLYLKKFFFFFWQRFNSIFYGWLNMKDPNFERKKA